MPVARSFHQIPKRKQIGNLIVNGDFPVNTGNWSLGIGVSLTWDNGRVRFEQASGYKTANQVVSVSIGSSYKISADIEDGTVTGGVIVRDGTDNTALSSLNSSTSSNTFTATSNSVNVQMRGTAGAGHAYFDNLALVKV